MYEYNNEYLPQDLKIRSENLIAHFASVSCDALRKSQSLNIQRTLSQVTETCRPVNATGNGNSKSRYVPGRGGYYPDGRAPSRRPIPLSLLAALSPTTNTLPLSSRLLSGALVPSPSSSLSSVAGHDDAHAKPVGPLVPCPPSQSPSAPHHLPLVVGAATADDDQQPLPNTPMRPTAAPTHTLATHVQSMPVPLDTSLTTSLPVPSAPACAPSAAAAPHHTSEPMATRAAARAEIRRLGLDVCLECGTCGDSDAPATCDTSSSPSRAQTNTLAPQTHAAAGAASVSRGPLLYCDYCDMGTHLRCLVPPLDTFPTAPLSTMSATATAAHTDVRADGHADGHAEGRTEGEVEVDVEWFCPDCRPPLQGPRALLPPSSGVSSLSALVRKLHTSSDVVVVLGAGASVAAGIPDFRSAEGVYAITRGMQLGAFQDRLEGQDLFDLDYFEHDPSAFYHFFFAFTSTTREAQPTRTHALLAALHARGKLRRVYTQNIDGLERRAGVDAQRLVLCHGDASTSSCTRCGLQCPTEALAQLHRDRQVPFCDLARSALGVGGHCTHLQYRRLQASGALPVGGRARRAAGGPPSRKRNRTRAVAAETALPATDVSPQQLFVPLSAAETAQLREMDVQEGVFKPDVVFFGEALPSLLEECVQEDAHRTDLILVIGTSLKVDPVASLPRRLSHDAPLVLINKEMVSARDCAGFDFACLGDADLISAWLMAQLQWD